ncbi:MAG: glycosyltransferase [Actinobacteria bacterium]|nr:glycosyltransferase [Actinomycetota bacterium]
MVADEVRALAERHGARYIARAGREGAKAGNVNNALRCSEQEIVLVLDADHVPRQDLLARLLGYFEDDSVAFVQTPQFYANWDLHPVARGAFEQQAIFYGPICRGKQGVGAAFCCGTNVLFRRRALEQVGGFNEDSIVEDFVTSMRLHRRGWRSVYFPYVLAEGLGPTTLREYFGQQFRWARGSVGALISGEPFRRGFALRQRLQYLLATTFYLTGLVTPIYLVLPVLYLLTGASPFSDGSGDFVLYYAPYFALGMLTLRWALGGRLHFQHLRYTFGTFPVYALASIAALLRLPNRFRVTSKDAADGARAPLAAWVTGAAFAITLLAIPIGLALQPSGVRTTMNAAWATIDLLLLWGIVAAALRESPLARHLPGRMLGGTLMLDTPAPRVLPLPEDVISPPGGQRRRSEAVPARPLLAIAAITALAGALRLGLIDAQGLRLDEATTLRQAGLPLGELWTGLAGHNVHVPLHHTLMHAWVALTGDSEIALRAPSVFLGTLAVPLLWAIGRRLCGEGAALFAAALAAGSPFLAWHSDEARMYPLLLVCALCATLLLLDGLSKGGRWRWAAYALALALAWYAHYFALVLPVAHLAMALALGTPAQRLRAWLTAVAGAVLLYLPWLALLFVERVINAPEAAFDNGAGAAAVTPFAVVYFVLTFFAGYTPGALAAALGLWPLAAIGAAVNDRFLPWLRTPGGRAVGIWGLVVLGGAVAAGAASPGAFLPRYAIIASAPLLLLAGAGLGCWLPARWPALLVVLGLGAGATIHENLARSNPMREDLRGAAAAIEHELAPGDIIGVAPNFVARPFAYHLGDGVRLRGLIGRNSAEDQQALEQAIEAARGHALWVLLQRLYEPSIGQNRLATAAGALERRLRRTRLVDLGNAQLRRYEVPKSLPSAPRSRERRGSDHLRPASK